MRRSGNTTRAVDAAIQTLFTTGEIIIPFVSKGRLKGMLTKSHVYDEGVEFSRKTQAYFFGRILERLENEHSGTFEVDDNMNVITVKGWDKRHSFYESVESSFSSLKPDETLYNEDRS